MHHRHQRAGYTRVLGARLSCPPSTPSGPSSGATVIDRRPPKRHRRDERHAAQGLERRDHGSPPPGGRELAELLRQPLDPSLRFVNRVAIFLQRDVLRGRRETEICQPSAVRQRPPVPSGIPTTLAQEEGLSRYFACVPTTTASSRARTRSRIASSVASGT